MLAPPKASVIPVVVSTLPERSMRAMLRLATVSELLEMLATPGAAS